MQRLLVSVLAVLLLSTITLAVPAGAGTVYAPVVTDRAIGNSLYTTEIRVTNNSEEVAELTYLFLAAWEDGTEPDRSTDSFAVSLDPHESRVLENLVPSDFVGFLEITAPDSVSVTSRLVGTSEDAVVRMGVDVPVITSSSLIAGGETAMLQGWSRADELVTDFYLINLASTPSECEISVRRRGGAEIITTAATANPLSMLFFDDALGKLGLASPSEVRASVTCEESFYAFVLLRSKTTAELAFVPPAGTGSSTLKPPGTTAPPAPSFPCPDDAWFVKDGAFHRPAIGTEARRFTLPVTPGRLYRKITIDMDFIPSEWNTPASGNHAIFWLNRGNRWGGNVYGYVNAFGPNKDFIKMSTNADLEDGADMVAYTGDAQLVMGERYHVRYTYDGLAQRMETVVTVNAGTEDEREIVSFRGWVPSRRIDTTNEPFYIWFGHPTGTAGPEVPTYDWLYLNLCAQIE